MGVNRSGYYKWKKRQGKKNRYELNRETLTAMIHQIHSEHRSYGYHAIAKIIRTKTDLEFSDNLIHKCCKAEKIRSKMRHYKYKSVKFGEEHCLYPNRVHNNWNAQKPLEIVVSDMTCISHNGILYEWTYFLDTYNNEIISSHVSGKRGDRRPYFNCLKDLKEKIKEQKTPIILHTDQGAIYSSRAFADAHKDYNIIRSMSRAGTPTDNPIIESINGWIKAEIKVDFQHKYKNRTIEDLITEYVEYYNNCRPAYALNYQSPVQYRIEQGFG